MKSKELLHLKITNETASIIKNSVIEYASNKESRYVCVANVHMWVESYKDNTFRTIVNSADIVTSDGQPLCWALNLIYKITQERVAGMDLLPSLLQEAENKSLSVYFYGGTSEMLEETKKYINNKYPELNISGSYSPPFRHLSPEEEADAIRKINKSGANIVFVILGCPKQEKWMAKMKGKINAVMIGVGGALPVLIGIQKRAPQWMQNAGLEWLYRLYQEPRRLFKRYAVTNTIFLYLLAKEIIKVRLLKKRPAFSLITL